MCEELQKESFFFYSLRNANEMISFTLLLLFLLFFCPFLFTPKKGIFAERKKFESKARHTPITLDVQ
jgi:hypothetical protein